VEQALSDVKVLDVTHYVAGPYCTKLLADYGADVIKIERPASGDPARGMGPFPKDEPHTEKSGLFLYLNTNKKGITLNLKTETGKNIFKDLVKDIDIVVENFEPRVMPGLGLGYETLSQINPKLVMTSISNFGQTGPYRDYKASELILFGMGSEMYATGLPDRKPVMIEPYANLFLTGSAAAAGTVAGFYASRYQEVGQHIDMAIIEALSTGTTRRGVNLIAYQYTGEVSPRIPSIDVGYPHGVHPCKEGDLDLFGGRTYWDRVVKMLGEPDWLKDPKWTEPTAQANPELKEEFEANFMAWLMERTSYEAAEEAQKAGAPGVPVQTMEDVVNDPHFDGRGAFIEIDHPVAGKFKYIGRPFIMSETPWKLRRPAPMLGQHNAEVYGNLGLSREELVRLRQQGVV
jgi:crotonobetainyl-CoA:carnitine CoA-transferase CaiB-like acyl-CoA transferase